MLSGPKRRSDPDANSCDIHVDRGSRPVEALIKETTMKGTQESNTGGWRRGASVVTLLTLAAGLGACGDSVDPVGIAGDQSLSGMADTELGAVLTDMTGPLGLSDGQAADVVAIGDLYGGVVDEPGVLWYVAADLQGALSSAQVDQLAASRAELRERARQAILERFGFGGELFGGRGPGELFGGRFGAGGFLGDREGPGGFFGPGEAPDCSEIGEAFGGRFGGFGRNFGGPGHGFGGFGAGLGGFGDFADIDLSDAQRAALQAIMLEYGPQLMDLMQQLRDGLISEEQFKELAEALGEEIQEAIGDVLTDEQVAAIEEMKERARAAAEAERAARIDALGLTDQQLADLEALRGSLAEQACETIVAGGSAEDLHAAHQEAVAEILTDDQVEIIEVHDALRAYLFVYHIENGDFAERFGF
jgi:hypothetical protein